MKRIFFLVLMFSMFSGVVYADECISGDCQNGQGTMKYDDGSEYVGEWKDGQHNGQGTFTLPDGRKEVGEWEDGNYNGQEKAESDSIKAQATTEELAYRSDTATILKLFGNIRDFQNGSSETEVQKKARERKLKKALVQINSRYKGTRLTLQRAELDNVIANDDIMHLFGGREEWEKPGKYTATYYIPVPIEHSDYETPRSGIAIGQRKDSDDGAWSLEEFRQGLPIGKLDFKSFEYMKVKIVKTYPNENSVINLQKGSIAPLTGTIRSVLYYEAGDELTIWID